MDQQVGVDHDVERRTECLDQLMGQLSDEADRVGQEDRLATGKLEAPGRGVERGEEPVLDEHAGIGHSVQERRLAGVGVAHDCHRPVAGAAAPLRLGGPVLPDAHEVLFELADPSHDPAPIDLQLGLARAPGSDATGLLAERAARATQAGQAVTELCQLDLGAARQAAGVLGEDVEDHRGAVQRRPLQDRLEVALLGRGELVVENDGVCVVLLGEVAYLDRLAAADVRGDVRGVAVLEHPGHRVGSGRVDQSGQLVHRGVDLVGVFSAQCHACQHDAFTERTVDEAAVCASELTEGAPV